MLKTKMGGSATKVAFIDQDNNRMIKFVKYDDQNTTDLLKNYQECYELETISPDISPTPPVKGLYLMIQS